MKTKSQIILTVFLVASCAFVGCEQKANNGKTGNTITEDLVEGADGGLDSLNAESDKADSSGTIPSDTLRIQ